MFTNKGTFLWNLFLNCRLWENFARHIHPQNVLSTSLEKGGRSECDKLDCRRSTTLTVSPSSDSRLLLVYHSDRQALSTAWFRCVSQLATAVTCLMLIWYCCCCCCCCWWWCWWRRGCVLADNVQDGYQRQRRSRGTVPLEQSDGSSLGRLHVWQVPLRMHSVWLWLCCQSAGHRPRQGNQSVPAQSTDWHRHGNWYF